MAASDSHPVEDTRRIAAFAAFGITAATLYNAVPILIAGALGVRPPSTDLASQVAGTVNHPVIFGSFGITFLILGASFIVLALALHDRLAISAPFAARVATATGIIGGAFVILQGFMPLTIPGPLERIHAQNQELAAAAYAANMLVTARVITTGFVMVAAFTVIASLVGARAGLISRPLSYLGILFAIALTTSHWLPGPLQLVPPALTLVWSAWLGIALLRGRPLVALAPGATTHARA